jgi:Putative prokaryotic signal transducing protein
LKAAPASVAFATQPFAQGMKTLYEAANAIEAHMLLDLLKQEGIEAHLHGEALQGAMGEVPVARLVRLTVMEQDYSAAREIIERWERTEVEATPLPKKAARSSGLRMLVLGLAVGVGSTYAAYRTPVTSNGIDHNRDGVLDETWTYAPNGTAIKMEADRNLDRKVDYVGNFNARGVMHAAEADDNFDGVFETKIGLRNGNAEVSETDTDGDGYADMLTRYVHGVVDTVEFLDLTSGKPLRVEHYALGCLRFADVDTDKDGKLDVRIKYTKLAEVVSKESLLK